MTKRTGDLLQRVGLADRGDDRVHTYSRGMKQRLHLARGLISAPEVLLLDEPTIGLDPVAARDLRELLRTLNRDGTTILLTTHYMAEAEDLCHRVAFLAEGRISLLDSPRQLTRMIAEFSRIDAELPVSERRVEPRRLSMAVLCGVNVPVTFLAEPVQAVAAVLPLTHGLAALRALLAGVPPEHVLGAVALEIAIGIAYFALARFSFVYFLRRARARGDARFPLAKHTHPGLGQCSKRARRPVGDTAMETHLSLRSLERMGVDEV